MKKNNMVFLILLYCMFLTACMPVVLGFGDPDIYNRYTVIQTWQKPDTIGHTDAVQRKKDFLACGVKKFFGGTLDFNTRYPGMTSDQVDQRKAKMYQCIKAKGYISVGPTSQCTKNGVDLGKCN